MAWNMSAAKRRALVKLQLRDKKGRWIEMGRGVKWYSSKRKKQVSGIVVDGAGTKAYVRLSKEDGGKVVAVEAHKIEVIENKAKLAPKGEKSVLDTPEFEQPEAVSDEPEDVPDEPILDEDPNDESAEPLAERSYPGAIDENDANSYKSTKTSDGKFYFGRADSEGIYTPAKDLAVGDELIAPDGTDASKPFSIGSGWNRRGIERVAEGKGLGTVESIVPDRYAVVKLPEGYAAPDGRQTVTVGLRNDVIKATPGLKKSLESSGFKFNAESPAETATEPSAEPVDVERDIMDDRRKRNNAAKVSAAQQGDKLVAERPEGALTFTKTGDNQWEDSDGGAGLSDEDVTATPVTLNEWTPAPMVGKDPVNAPVSAPEPVDGPEEPTTPSGTSEAQQRFDKLQAEVADLPLDDPRNRAFNSARQNVADTEREQGKKLDIEEWNDLFLSSYDSALEDLKSADPSQTDPVDAEPTPVADVVEGVSRIEQDMEDIIENDLQGEDLAAALEEAVYTFTGKDGLDYTVAGRLEGDGEWSFNVTDFQGDDAGNWTPGKYDSTEELANDIHATINKKRSDEPQEPATEPVDAPAAQSYNENGLTAEEQTTADALTRMIARAESQGNFEKADQLANQLAQMMRQGEERKAAPAPEPVEAPAEPGKAATGTVPLSQLEKLPTSQLIEQYDLAISSQKGRFSNTAPRQKRIDAIVDLMSKRADDGDEEALAWYDNDPMNTTSVPNLIEPTDPVEADPVDAPTAPEPVVTIDAAKVAKSLTALQKAMIVAMRDDGWNAGSRNRAIRTGAVRQALENKGLIRPGRGRASGDASYMITDNGTAVADVLSPPVAVDPVEAPSASNGKKSSLDEWKDSLDALMSELDAPEHKEAGNRITAAVQKMNGLDGAPTVVSKADFDALPGKKLYRGVSSEEQAERFNTGPNWVGEGGSGSGIYTSTNRFRGESFKRAEGGALMEMKLNPEANIADGTALEAERKVDLDKATAEGNTVGMFLADGDMGKYAAARGFDGYTVPPIDPYGDDEEYVVLTNRAAVSVLESPAKSEGTSEPSSEPTEAEPVQAPVDGPTEPEPAPVEPVETSHIEFLETTPDGFKVRESETNPGYIEVVAPDGVVARRAKISEGDLENKIKAGMDAARVAYEDRVRVQAENDQRRAAIAALTPFEPVEIPAPANAFRTSDGIREGDRLLTMSRPNGSEGVIQNTQSSVARGEAVQLSGKSALVTKATPIMGQNRTSLGKRVGMRVELEHSDGQIEKLDLYSNRGGTGDKAGVFLDTPEFREELGALNPAAEPTEGQNGTESGTDNGTSEPVETEGGPTEGPGVSEPAGGNGGTGNDPASGTDPTDGGEGTGSGPDSGLSGRSPLSKEDLDDLPEGSVVVDSDGFRLAKNEEGDWYSVARFLESGDKEGLYSELLDGSVTHPEGQKYGEDEFVPAVNHYIKNSFKSVNDYIRNGNDPAPEPGYTDTVIDVMDDAIAHSPLAKDATFFRGLQISAGEAEKFVAGSIISDKGFTSVSADRDIAGAFAHQSSRLTGVPGPENPVPVVLEVNLPKGHNALAIDYSKIENESWSDQQESVLARDSAFKVDSVEISEDGVYTLKVSPATEADLQVIPAVEPEPASVFPEGIIRREPTTVPGEKYPPTQQQQDVIDAVLGGLDTKVQAMAGTGKTSTLVALSRRIAEHGKQAIYIAFNKTVQEEAEERMKGLPVEAKTGHGVAYQWALKNAPHLIARLNGGDPTRPKKFDKNGKATDWEPKYTVTSTHRIAGMLDINNGDVKAEGGQDLRASTIVLAVKKTVEKYALSDKDEVGIEHVPDSFEIDEDSKQAVVDFAKKYWDDLNSETGDFRITHDVYRKIWALSRPDLTDGSGGNKKGANILYIDEAQDTPPVLAKVVADQKMQKVIVGDPNQAIYAFAENIDYLSEAEGDIELPLNKSWRFGPKVADIGNRFLEFLGSKDRVVGGGGESEITYGMENADAVLVRTNAGMISVILEEAKRGRRVSAPKGTKEDLTKLVKTVQGLMDEDPLDSPHDDLIGFKDWGQVLSAWNNGDNSLNKIVNLFDVVDAYSVSRLNSDELARAKQAKMDNAVKAIDMLVTKVAKSEGVQITKEGGRTFISPVDVHPDPKMKDKWVGNVKKFAVKSFSEELGKLRAPEAFDKSLNWSEQMNEYHRKGGLGSLGFKFDTKSSRWYSDDEEAAQKLSTYFGEFDVTVSTAHKSKGLEWDRVRIGDDFFIPRENPKTGVLEFPEDPAEYKLAYVAVTRAAKELDPGVLGWIYEHTSENGGDPNKVATPTVDPVDSPTVDPVETDPVEVVDPEPVSAPVEPEPVDPEPVDVPTEPEPVSAPAPVEPAEPAPVPGYNANGYTEAEQKRVDELEALIAAVYRGDVEGDIDALENELDAYYAAAESRLNGVDVPEIKYNAPEPVNTPDPVSAPPVNPAPVNTPAPAPTSPTEPTTPKPRTRTNMTGVKVLALGGEELVEGTKVRHPKYTGTVIKVIPSAGTVRIRKEDGTEVIARGHKVSVIPEGADPVAAPSPAVVDLKPGSAGIDPATGLPYFVGRDGQVFQIGDTIVHAKKGEGTVKSIYVGATSVAVDWADGTKSRSQANALYGKDNGGETAPEPVDPPSVEPTEPAPVEPEPEPVVVPEPAPTPTVKLTGQFTDPEPKKKLTVKGGGIEGGDPVGKAGPVSPHGEPVPGDQSDLMVLSMLYPTGTVITYHNKSAGVKYRVKKGDDFMWNELNEDGSVNLDGFHQYLPALSRVQMHVKIDPNGKRDDRNGAPDNEEFLNSLPIGTEVTTNGHWDGSEKIWTKLAQGFWKTDDQSALNGGVTRYSIIDFSGDGEYEANLEGWTAYESSPTRKMKIYRLPEGAEITFAKAPNVKYVRENGMWAESVRGRKTGSTFNNLNAIVDNSNGWPAFVNMANVTAAPESSVPKREKPATLTGDPKEIEAVFGSDMTNYAGINNLFREYDRETSPLNTVNVPPVQPKFPTLDAAEVTNSNGDKFTLGARVYDKNGDYLGKVSRIMRPARAYDENVIELMHPRGVGLAEAFTPNPKVNPEDVTTVRTKHWDTSTDLDFSDYTTVSSIERKMNETYGGMVFKLAPRSTDIRMAREYAATVSKIFNKYPQLQESIAFVGTQPYGKGKSTNASALSFGPDEYGVTGWPSANSYEPRYGHVGTRVGFNVSKSYDEFVRGKRRSVATRWNNHVEVGKEVEATTTHEFGHVLDYFTGVINEDKILEMVSEVLGREVTVNDSRLGNELFANNLLSEYSLKHGNIYAVELVAESFQDVEMNGENAKELSKLVHQELMRRLAILSQSGIVSVNNEVVSVDGKAV